MWPPSFWSEMFKTQRRGYKRIADTMGHDVDLDHDSDNSTGEAVSKGKFQWLQGLRET
jgi:beta-glucanase (GH16 family)